MNGLFAALRMLAPVIRTDSAAPGRTYAGLPVTLSYADAVRRFDPTADPVVAVSHASAVAHLLRLHRTLETLDGLALARGGRSAVVSDRLYQAHGEPRD